MRIKRHTDGMDRLDALKSAMWAPLVAMNVTWRKGLIQQIGQTFFRQNPDSMGINLGAGLTDYFPSFSNGHNRWLDVDLKPVNHLRHALLAPHGQAHRTGSIDLTQPGWWQRLQLSAKATRQPLLLVCDEVLMYMTPAQVKAVLHEIGENAHEGTQLVCDFMTPLGISRAALKSEMHRAGAPLLWGAQNGLEVARMHPRLELLAQHTSAEVYGPMTCMAEMCMSPWTGGPLCGVAHLLITEP
jgi:O-methyltransferase involved in polyketide biosynthesis